MADFKYRRYCVQCEEDKILDTDTEYSKGDFIPDGCEEHTLEKIIVEKANGETVIEPLI
jgi:hypothetical protein